MKPKRHITVTNLTYKKDIRTTWDTIKSIFNDPVNKSTTPNIFYLVTTNKLGTKRK